MVENLKKLAITFGIIVLLPTTVHLGNKVLLKAPDRPRSQNISNEEFKLKLEEYNQRENKFSEYQFYTNLIIGSAAILSGGFIIPITFLASGFIIGGIFCIIDGYFTAWSVIKDLAKFLSLLVVLIFLILVGISIFINDQKN